MATASVRRLDFDHLESNTRAVHFSQMMQSIESLHRRFLDLLSNELMRSQKTLSAIQALILHHIGDDSVSLGDLIARGYYQGTNLGYNIAKLGDSGFVTLTKPQWDKRSTRVCLTTSGREVAVFVGSLLDDHSNRLADIGLNEADLLLLSRAFKGLEKHWSSLLTAA